MSVFGIFTGVLAKMFGGKYLFGGGIVATGILSLLTAPVANTHVYLLIALRVLEGLCEVNHYNQVLSLVFVKKVITFNYQHKSYFN